MKPRALQVNFNFPSSFPQITGGCDNETKEGDCIKPKAANIPGSGGGGSTTSHPIRALIFGLAGMAMVGLLLFAVVRLRKVTAQKREAQETRDRPVEGVDNEALMNMVRINQ